MKTTRKVAKKIAALALALALSVFVTSHGANEPTPRALSKESEPLTAIIKDDSVSQSNAGNPWYTHKEFITFLILLGVLVVLTCVICTYLNHQKFKDRHASVADPQNVAHDVLHSNLPPKRSITDEDPAKRL